MGKESIPLAKGFDVKKLVFPVGLSVKHDGVPVRIDVVPTEDGISWATQARSGDPLPSCDGVVQTFLANLTNNGYTFTGPTTFVAEVTHLTFTDFKDIGGVVRRKEPQEGLVLNFFDFTNHCDAPWFIRQRMLRSIMRRSGATETARYVHQHLCRTEDELMSALAMARSKPDADKVEGYIARSSNAVFKAGTRHWDYQKIVEDPTVDLRITGVEEAVSKDGEPLGMVGRVIADFHGEPIGVGPGKLSHVERIALWRNWQARIWPPVFATIKYKRDPSYAALRQPTFQHWRPEKTQPSYE